MEDLNNYSETQIPIDEFNTLNIKLFPTYPPPPPVSGTPRACLRFTLRLPTEGSSCEATGFSGAITFARPLTPSARVVTRVHMDNVPVSQEVHQLQDQTTATRVGQTGQERYVAMLPDSVLSRCNLLNMNGKKTRIIQQVILSADLPTTKPTGSKTDQQTCE